MALAPRLANSGRFRELHGAWPARLWPPSAGPELQESRSREYLDVGGESGGVTFYADREARDEVFIG